MIADWALPAIQYFGTEAGYRRLLLRTTILTSTLFWDLRRFKMLEPNNGKK